MTAYIISIGDEILIGQIINTNAAWIATQLNGMGIPVLKIMSIADTEEAIMDALLEAESRADLVLMTGGLGPTRDDLTKKALARFFETPLVFHEPTYARIVKAFEKRGIPVTDLHHQQCFLPESCDLATNPKGTAPGMWFEKNGRYYLSMPGVPYEMKALMEKEFLPRIQQKMGKGAVLHHSLELAGTGETVVAKLVEPIEDSLPPHIKLAYLPHLGSLTLRLTARGTDNETIKVELAHFVEKIKTATGEFLYGENGASIEESIGKLLLERKQKMGTAESCTGGLIAHQMTSYSGSSSYVNGGIVAYSNEIKTKLLGVTQATLQEHGAVSEATVLQMAKGALDTLDVDYAVAVSGIAGPTGARPGKPVGTIWIGVANKKNAKSRLLQLGKDRMKNVRYTATLALNELRKFILEE